jgi:hypothetical protein
MVKLIDNEFIILAVYFDTTQFPIT